VNIKDSFCNKPLLLHDVSGKLVQTLDSAVGWGWGWGRGNLHGDMGWGIFNGDAVGTGNISWGRDGDGENFMGMG